MRGVLLREPLKQRCHIVSHNVLTTNRSSAFSSKQVADDVHDERCFSSSGFIYFYFRTVQILPKTKKTSSQI